MATQNVRQNVCQFNKFGYCRYKENCRKMHVDKLCDNPSCELSKCIQRHPKVCKWDRDLNRCKFYPCKFTHIVKEDNQTALEEYTRENERIVKKLAEIEKELKAVQQSEEEIIQKRILNEKISNLGNRLAEKDIQINDYI